MIKPHTFALFLGPVPYQDNSSLNQKLSTPPENSAPYAGSPGNSPISLKIAGGPGWTGKYNHLLKTELKGIFVNFMHVH